ncbi:MAG: response regulator [Nitrospirae bacterium]|nr:MAG: response regulator [Nitrospirota bacterium]
MADRILLVDDDPMMRGLASRMLGALGYACETAGDGAEAARLLDARGGAFRAVVTDLMMPGTPGGELLAFLEERFPRLPVVVTTGDTVAADRLRQGRRGRAVVVKPFRLAELQAGLAEALGEGAR